MDAVTEITLILKLLSNLQSTIDILRNDNQLLRDRLDKIESKIRNEEYNKMINKEIK